MAHKTNSNVAQCPECEGPVQLGGKLQVGRKLSCRQCGSTLLIIDRKPLELVLANGYRPEIGRSKANREKDEDVAVSSSMYSSKHKENPQMQSKPKVSVADCPECNAVLRFHKPLKENQLVVCPDCNETLEVVSLRPLELSWANEDPWEYREYDNPRHLSR